ncbi:NADH-quinone oxidoreductase subunit D [Candidatus Fermentibacteria bacterium]|nr:MAG: NADH-quinone oxidoreductase subunit D [Candidatus Fermentibacteria bacterium]
MSNLSESKYRGFKADRSKYPEMENGKPVIDLESHRYTKLWQGPQHPGVTGNMAVELIVNGDEIVSAKTHVGYLHRAFEKLMERRRYIQCFPLVCRICVPEPDTNEYCVSAAMEDLAGITVPERALWLRTLNLEMSRIGSYLMWLGGQAGSLGMGAVGQWTIGMRDFWLDLFEEMTGGRVYHMYMIPGGVRKTLPDGFRDRARGLIVRTRKLLYDVENTFLSNAIIKSRLQGLGVITTEMVDEFGIVGPIARATGRECDIRINNPYVKYGELDVKMLTSTVGDAYARAELRYRDLHQSLDLVTEILNRIPEDGPIQADMPNLLNWKIPAGQTYVKAESTRGEHGFYMVSDGSGKPRRVFARGASYTHAISLLEELAVNISISDLAGLMVSLHTCPPEIER